MTVDLEALMRKKERILSANTTMVGMSMHPPSGGPKAPRVYLQNRLLHRERESGGLVTASESGST